MKTFKRKKKRPSQNLMKIAKNFPKFPREFMSIGFLTPGQATEVRNITTNLGILPINLGAARLHRNEHTFVHYYDLQPLFDEYASLNAQYDELRLTYLNNTLVGRELDNYNRIVQYSRSSISSKINNIRIHNRKISKRGLIDGVGSIIKSLTGNLDASDGEKIYSILNHMQVNEHNLQNQLKHQYSVNHQTIKNFNETIQDIQHNELIINAMHPSIINPHDLFLEIENISQHYQSSLPFEVKYENILDFESILKIHCKIDSDRITYFLSMPIYYEREFNLFYMLPIPTKHQSDYLTIIPKSKFFLKDTSDNSIRPLSDMCTQGKWYHCPNNLQVNYRTPCEENILLNQNSSGCHFTRLEIKENHIEAISETNQYLAVFIREEKIVAHCKDSTDTILLTGTFLITRDSCDLFFKEKKLVFQETSHGKPLIISALNLQPNTPHDNPEFQIKLKKLNLKELPIDPIIPITDNLQSYDYHIPSLWTIMRPSS
ncbi:hypothetical protein NQ315_008976 [Exocentrus adspersus]|uniref:Uncharacterized protein n=1 Tax=Exocentrus adspersus TaxID=1586481 RepID=A0AAV8VIM1_9CUCU|nr:hypothetical protein NQ315_008976 [Exocentrus adspersus]